MRGGDQEDQTAAAPGEERRARRVAVPPILLGALAGLVLCGLGYLALNAFAPRHSPSQMDAQPTLRAICADLTGQRYDHLYTLLDPTLQAQGNQAQFVASQRQLDTLLGPVTACAPGSPTLSGSSVSVSFSLTREGARQSAPAQATLASEGGAWRITSYSGAL